MLLKVVRSGTLQPSKLVTHRFTINDIMKAEVNPASFRDLLWLLPVVPAPCIASDLLCFITQPITAPAPKPNGKFRPSYWSQTSIEPPHGYTWL
jgi:hypothetical protein